MLASGEFLDLAAGERCQVEKFHSLLNGLLVALGKRSDQSNLMVASHLNKSAHCHRKIPVHRFTLGKVSYKGGRFL